MLVCLEQELHPTIYEEIHQFYPFHQKVVPKNHQGQKKKSTIHYSCSIVDSSEGWRAFEGTAESRRDPSFFFSATQEEGT